MLNSFNSAPAQSTDQQLNQADQQRNRAIQQLYQTVQHLRIALMFPPIPPGLLHQNPHFADLYSHLTTRLLDPTDCSTRAISRPNDALDQVRRLLLLLRLLTCLGAPHPPCRACQKPPPPNRAGSPDQPGHWSVRRGAPRHPRTRPALTTIENDSSKTPWTC